MCLLCLLWWFSGCSSDGSYLGDEGGNLLSVFDELDSYALPDGRVGLLSLHADLLQNDPFHVRGTAEWIRFQGWRNGRGWEE